MELNQESHYVSFLSENAPSEDEGCQPRPSIRGSVSQSLREVMTSIRGSRSAGNEGSHRSSSSFPSYYLQNARYWWRKFERNTNMKVRLLCITVLVAVAIFFVTILMLGSNISTNPAEVVESDIHGSNVTKEVPVDSLGFPISPYHWKEEHFVAAFNRFEKEYNRNYISLDERAHRYNIFKQNQSYINLHNMQGRSYKVGMNDFGDLTNKEFRERYVGKKKMPTERLDVGYELLDRKKHTSLPGSFDWRTKNCVSDVKDQKMCGSCWAFSVTGAVEGAVCAKSGKLPLLSEQQLVDCAGPEGNNGCDGGDMQLGFLYILHAGGLCSEDGYPYEAKTKKCKAEKCKPVAQIKGYKAVPPKSEEALQTAIVENGPVSVSIEADEMPFQFYVSGVFDDNCGSDLDHGVLAVGYGVDEATNKKFWIVKNSWGSSWGDKGYIKMAMNKGDSGQCGILLDSSYPLA